MREFFNLNPTGLPAVLFWYFGAIGGGLLFVIMTIRLQAQGQAVQRAQEQATSGRKPRRGKATSPAPSTVNPLHHAPYWGLPLPRLNLAKLR